MKKIAFLFFLISFTASLQAQKISCEESARFGDIDVCLPEITGMTEAYSHPTIKDRADAFNFEGNSILAYYIDNEAYQQIDSVPDITFDDYFQIYVTDKLKGVKFGKAELDQLAEMIKGSYIAEKWEDIQQKIEKNDPTLSVGQPVLIDSYTPSPEVRSFIMLVKVQREEESVMVIASMNAIRVKNRVIWLACYNKHTGEASVKRLKTKNDNIVSQLVKVNK